MDKPKPKRKRRTRVENLLAQRARAVESEKRATARIKALDKEIGAFASKLEDQAATLRNPIAPDQGD